MQIIKEIVQFRCKTGNKLENRIPHNKYHMMGKEICPKTISGRGRMNINLCINVKKERVVLQNVKLYAKVLKNDRRIVLKLN